MLNTKHCKKCDITHTINNFPKSNTKDGLHCYCKPCERIRGREYARSKVGLCRGIYKHQRHTSKKRGYHLPTYTSDELMEWLYSQPLFHRLYDNWKRLDYQRDYVPSVDRKDDYISYTMDNIQLMTWKDNNIKNNNDMKNGKNRKALIAVVQKTLNSKFIAEYYSISEASEIVYGDRTLGTHITRCCKYKKPQYRGCTWEYKVI